MWALRILITSFIAGVVSLFGYSRRGRKLVLWIAVIGTVVSFVLGFLSYVYWHMSQTFHGIECFSDFERTGPPPSLTFFANSPLSRGGNFLQDFSWHGPAELVKP